MRMNKLMAVAAATGAAALAGGIAYAAIPAADGTITACTDSGGRNVRLIDTEAGGVCATGEKKVAWNQRGRTGPTGYPGQTGAPGPAYYVRVGANDDNTPHNTTRTKLTTWNYGDIVWINTPYLDVTKCAVSALPVSDQLGAAVQRITAGYKDWIGLYTHVNLVRTRMPVDVTIACSEYDDPWNANY